MLSTEMKKQLLRLVAEDIGGGDVTTAVVRQQKCRAAIVAKEACTVAGLEEAAFLFRSRGVKAKALARDCASVKKGRKVLSLEGSNKGILVAERTALNVLGRMSGVASACAEAKKAAGSGVTVALTRKTMPGFNLFDKKAAKVAGVWTHRINLNRFVLLKGNHLVFFRSAGAAVRATERRYKGSKKVEVEVESLREAFEAAAEKPDIIMLDNFSPLGAKKAVKKLRAVFRGKIELSGGINLSNLRAFAAAKPDIISMGGLTHSVASKNFSLEIGKAKL